jgi:hypothetical protein
MNKKNKKRRDELRARKGVLGFQLRLMWLLATRDGFARSFDEYVANMERWLQLGPLPREYRKEMKKCPKLKLVS